MNYSEHNGKSTETRTLVTVTTRIFALIMAIFLFSMSSCSLINTKKQDEPDAVPSSSSNTENSSFMHSAQNQVEESSQTESSSKIFVNDSDNRNIKQQYLDFIDANSARYSEFQGEESTFEPKYTYVDLDNDSVDELIYFLEFFSEENFAYSFAYVYLFDIVDGAATEVFGSDSVGKSRLTTDIRVFEDGGKTFIAKELRDGRDEQIGTLYSYNGKEITVDYSISGCYNEPSYFSVSYLGEDAFTVDAKYFTDITEDEFSVLQKDLGNKGKTLFDSDEQFDK